MRKSLSNEENFVFLHRSPKRRATTLEAGARPTPEAFLKRIASAFKVVARLFFPPEKEIQNFFRKALRIS